MGATNVKCLVRGHNSNVAARIQTREHPQSQSPVLRPHLLHASSWRVKSVEYTDHHNGHLTVQMSPEWKR
uniref:Uncharacterized protein n=1 Tax=Anguilla anguilla TaxID=7936 RepID=A0A0E9WPB1_ANGAN